MNAVMKIGTGNVIALVRSSGCWAAKYISGPELDKVRTAFDTDTMPLPFTEEAEAPQVRKHVQAQYRNSGVDLVVFTLTGEYQRACGDAATIYAGACNPLGISKALATTITACYVAGDTMDKSLTWAPARLIFAQLGHLLGVGHGDYSEHSPYTPQEDMRFCDAVSSK